MSFAASYALLHSGTEAEMSLSNRNCEPALLSMSDEACLTLMSKSLYNEVAVLAAICPSALLVHGP